MKNRRLFAAMFSFVFSLGLVCSLSQISNGVSAEVCSVAKAESVPLKGERVNPDEMKAEEIIAVEDLSEDLVELKSAGEEAFVKKLSASKEVLEPAEEEVKPVSYADVTESVYATTAVNVRSGPGTEFKKLGMYCFGDSVVRTGIGDNGWSRIDYNGQTAYMCSDYLSTVAPGAGEQEESRQDAHYEAAEDVVFEDVSETVYATTAVNVRSGPGTGFEKLGMYSCGSAVARTGIGDNGWSRIDYNGQAAYMCSDYLSYEKVEPPKGKLGTAGRLSIPSVGVDVALYHCSSKAEYVHEQQRIVDNTDSAAYLYQEQAGGVLIADHKHQGFNAMKKSVPYKTVAYIDFGDYTQKYICTGIGVGKNLGSDLVDWNGVSLNYGYIQGGLAMYTCNENSTNITISYWEPA